MPLFISIISVIATSEEKMQLLQVQWQTMLGIFVGMLSRVSLKSPQHRQTIMDNRRTQRLPVRFLSSQSNYLKKLSSQSPPHTIQKNNKVLKIDMNVLFTVYEGRVYKL